MGCGQRPPSAPPPGREEKKKVESELAYITLSKKAHTALGIQSQAIEPREVQERMTLTGWIMAKPGHEVIVTAPAAGYVRRAKNQARVPIAGDRVEPEQELLVLEPVLSPVEQIQLASLKRGVESELAKAKTTLQTATAEHQRIRELHAQNLRSLQDLEQAQKVYEHAKEDLAAANDKLKLFTTTNIPLRAPRSGSILALHVSPDQYVAAAAPVVTVIDLQPVWVRVPVPEFDLPQIEPDANVTVTLKSMNGSTAATWLTAHPAGRVTQVDPQRHTADFWYEIETAKNATSFVRDQMVTVHIPVGKKSAAMVIPYAAIVFDATRSAWVYLERTDDDDQQHRFVRQRVDLGAAVDDGLIVRAGLPKSERVVTKGAAVLFSREFHKTPVADDDDD